MIEMDKQYHTRDDREVRIACIKLTIECEEGEGL